tara:strand:+ start:1641 stop:3515 length:1875 start_codon:yes stop_codon:yes gene_type:complete
MASPSKTLPLVDVPEATTFQTSFEYFGYDVAESLVATGAGSREVVGSFYAVEDTSEFSSLGTGIAALSAGIDDVLTSLDRGEFLDESVATANFTNLVLQDYYVDEKASELIAAAASGLNLDLENLAPADGAAAIISTLFETAGTEVNTIADVEGASISNEIISAILQQAQFNESLEPVGIEPGDTIIGSLAGLQHINMIDSRIVQDIAKSTAKNKFSSFGSNLSYIISDLDVVQSDAITDYEDGTLATDFFEYGVVPIHVVSLDDPDVAEDIVSLGEAAVVGYLIEKSLVSDTGESEQLQQFFIEQPVGATVGTPLGFTDSDVKTAATYAYALSTIAVARVPDLPEEGGELSVYSDIVIKSRVQTSVITTGIGFPPTPSDISFIFEEETDRLLIQWSFGDDDINTKKFQILRRESIDEPFELIRQYDFDDSEVPLEPAENVDFGLDVKLDDPLLYYIDENFKRNKKYIYALCSIGSDGGSSPLSAQYDVFYDNIIGELAVRLVSVGGAPKPYPNFYLDTDLTTNIGKVSNISKAEVFFTPEVYNVTKNSFDEVTGEVIDTQLLDFIKEFGPVRNTGKYFIEITELGTFQQSVVTLAIADTDTADPDGTSSPLTGDQGFILDYVI